MSGYLKFIYIDSAPAPTSSHEFPTIPNDFCLYVNKYLTDAERLSAFTDHYQPCKNYQFPVHEEYGKKRSFNPSWLDNHKWLVYSPTKDGAYCKICVLFGTEENSSKLDRLVKSPLVFWTTACEKLNEHALKSPAHKTATIKCENFIRIMKAEQTSIDLQINTITAINIERNKKMLASIIETILFCGHQNISLRGHRESFNSNNPGNFKSLLQFRVESGDEILKEHFSTAPGNAQYTSHKIQDDIVSLIGSQIQKTILGDIEAGSKLFAVIADECRDCSNKEQMSLVIRFVDACNTIQETFLGFFECEFGTSGAQLAELIEHTCTKVMKLDMARCRGQGYDGAGNMAGECSGAAKLIKLKFPKALYFHCASHKLNLCVAHMCKISSVANMMDAITCFANFFNFSPKRQNALEECISKYPDALKTKLLPLCRTRWIERIDALETALDLLEAIVDTFSCISDNADRSWNRDSVIQAFSLLKRIDFEFIINLVITQKAIVFTAGITTSLQKRGIDLVNVNEQIQLVIRTIQDIRKNVSSFHYDCHKQAARLAQKINVEVKSPRICKRQTQRSNALLTTATDTSAEEIIKNYFRVNVTIPVLDDIITSLQDRFCNGQDIIMKGTVLLPSYVITEPNWKNVLQPFLKFYSDELPCYHSVDSEFILWNKMWHEQWESHWKSIQEQHLHTVGVCIKLTDTEVKKLKANAVPNTIAATLANINKDIFPNIYYMLTILAVLPITTCEAERSFSTLRRLKTYLRSTMAADRLTSLALMHIHRDMPINTEQLIEDFAIQHPRRLKLRNILDSNE